MRFTRALSPRLDDGLRLGRVLRQRREALGQSREELARRALVSTETLTKIERGDTVDPGLFTVKALADGLHWSVDTLLDTVFAYPLPVTPLRFTADQGLLSIGYEGRSIDDLVQELTVRNVRLLADVRLNAISRKSGLSKKALAATLGAAGIAYEHLPVLGNPKDNRAGFADPRDELARNRYSQILATPVAAAAIRHLVQAADQGLVALMCFERDSTSCHRQLVLDTIRTQSPKTAIQRA